jgi:methyl-accepting chemotaxis protein
VITPNDWDIRPRAVLIAALPTMVMALVLIAYFTSSRLSDLEDAHFQRGKALARQLAAASEYGVFSGNLESLRKQANSILQERDVVRVAVFSPLQEVLADSNRSPPAGSGLSPRERSRALLFREQVTGPGITLDDNFLETGSNGAAQAQVRHGEVLIEMSRESLRAEEARLLQNAILMVTAVLIASVALALRMSRGISGPILRIASTVASFGQGNLNARVPVEGGKSLRTLAEGGQRHGRQAQRLAGRPGAAD